MSDSVIKNNNANNVWNALMLVFSDKNKIYDNDFGICSNVCLYMWGSSFNEIEDNIFNWGHPLRSRRDPRPRFDKLPL